MKALHIPKLDKGPKNYEDNDGQPYTCASCGAPCSVQDCFLKKKILFWCMKWEEATF